MYKNHISGKSRLSKGKSGSDCLHAYIRKKFIIQYHKCKCVLMTTTASDLMYDSGIKSSKSNILKTVCMDHNANSSYIFNRGCFLHTDCLRYVHVDDNEGFGSPIWIADMTF